MLLSYARRLSAALLLALAVAAPARATDQEFRRGLSAFNRGEYETAIAEWSPGARAGEPDAQAGLAYMFFKGMGVRQDRALAADLYQRAAAQGQPEAQMFLGAMYLYGDGLVRDLVRAHSWCELAQANGALGALGCRDQAALQMTQSEIDSSNRIIAQYYRDHASPPAR